MSVDDVKALIARIQAEMESYEPSKLGDDPSEFDSWRLLYDAKSALEAATSTPAVDREALAFEMYTGYTAHGWHRADENERRDWLLVAQQVINSGILRDVRDVQAEALEDAASACDEDWGEFGYYGPDGLITYGTVPEILRARAQAIREARNERD